MKRLILFELILIFFATTFETDSPPGWFQQVLPVNDQINDIFFLDSLTGWVVTAGASSGSDTGYVMKTTDGGNSWSVQLNQILNLNVVQFLDANTGYAGGGYGFPRIIKTTNAGNSWNNTTPIGNVTITDMYFINKDTGWACDDDPIGGGLWRTTNGSSTWQPQLGASFSPKKLFFLNKDTGWVVCNSNLLYRTTDSGLNWELQATLAQQLNDIYFFNQLTGILTSGVSYKTTNGGFNWVLSNDGGIKITFANDTLGWAGSNFNRIMKTTNGGNSWFRQASPIFDNSSTQAIDTLKAWAGGTGLVRTTDGGGPPIGIQWIGNEVPDNFILYQNYPNPFNPVTNIKYSIMSNMKRQTSNVRLVIFDITGKEVKKLVDKDQSAGTYLVDWNASGFSSGVYFYSLMIEDNLIDTKKMLMIK